MDQILPRHEIVERAGLVHLVRVFLLEVGLADHAVAGIEDLHREVEVIVDLVAGRVDLELEIELAVGRDVDRVPLRPAVVLVGEITVGLALEACHRG